MATSDDEFLDLEDDLIDNNDFLELQEQALRATQKKSTAPHTSVQSVNGNGFRAVHDRRLQPATNGNSFSSDSFANQSFDYADLDDQVLDIGVADAPPAAPVNVSRESKDSYNNDEVTAREQWRQNRFSTPSRIAQGPRAGVGTSLPHRGPTPTSPISNRSSRPSKPGGKNGNVVDFRSQDNGLSLEAKLQQLLEEKEQWDREREQLQQEVQAAQEQVLGKSGEISVIRSNHARQEREKERMINELKQQQAQREEHHKQDLELAKKEKESLVTHNRFLDHERNDSTWEAPIRKTGKGKTANGAATPKRQRIANLGDGFDDTELGVSPTKSARKPKAITPKHGAKRKRDVFTDSPGQPLQFSQEAGEFLQDASAALQTNEPSKDATTSQDTRFEFLQLLLGHRIRPGVKRTFEAFASLTFPSDPNTALSSLFMDRMSKNNTRKDIQDYPASVGLIVLSIMERCLEEKYYKPVEHLVDLLKFILLNSALTTVSHLLVELVRLTQLTIDVNIIPRFRTLKPSARAGGDTKDSSLPGPSSDICVKDCLELLLLTATLCAADSHLIQLCWRTIRFDFISMLLRVTQHVTDVIMTVKLLEPCVQDDALDVIRPLDPAESLTSEQHIIDRLTSMLIESPRPIEGAGPYSPLQVLDMRLEILLLIAQIVDNKLSGRAFAMHPQALGRIVRVLCDELSAIYVNLSGMEERSEIVNQACRIVFHVTIKYGDEIDLQEKLRSQPNGVNKYLIAMSRLAFSDAIYFERGIEEDVFDCAHQMLEEFVTPEEAEALRRAFVREDR